MEIEGHGGSGKNQGHGQGEDFSLVPGHPLQLRVDQANKDAQEDGQEDLPNREDKHGQGAEGLAGEEGGRHGRGDPEGDDADGIIQGNDRDEDIHQVSLGLVLADDHEGGGGGGGTGDGPQKEGKAQAGMEDEIGTQSNQEKGTQGLDDGDNDDLGTQVLQFPQVHLKADGKGDEGQGNIVDDGEALDAFLGQKAQDGGADQEAGNQVAGHVREFQDP